MILFNKKIERRHIILCSSSLAAIFAALSLWVTIYTQSPEQADMDQLNKIKTEYTEYLATEQATKNNEDSLVMAWWYPGEPACSAVVEAKQANLDVVKPEFFTIKEGGVLELMLEEKYGCNGFSLKNVEITKTLAKQQFVVVSSSYAADMESFLKQDELTDEHVTYLTDFVITHDFTGIELDFEDYGGWSVEGYENYKNFLQRLGESLHNRGKKLMIDLPAVRNSTEENWYEFRLSELAALPIDYLVIMAYDYQYDHGAGQPVAPLDWLVEVVDFTKYRVVDNSKIVIGVPTYGYIADRQTETIKILTGEQVKEYAIYKAAERDLDSKEMIAEGGKMKLVYQDSESIDAKVTAINDRGIDKISLWHLGGNPLYSR